MKILLFILLLLYTVVCTIGLIHAPDFNRVCLWTSGIFVQYLILWKMARQIDMDL